MPVAERHETLAAAFEAFRRAPEFGPAWLAPAREAAFARFLDRGFPSTREEEWRFTSVAPIASLPLAHATGAAVEPGALAPYLFDGVPTVVVVNGRVSKALSTIDGLTDGVTVGNPP
jgi:Fe-S cluster assembly protein SufD